MKIAFLFKRDSHFKAVKSTALRVCVQYNCEPVFIGIDSDYSPSNESYSITYIDKYDLSCLSEYDYVIACLGGYLLNQVVSALKDTDTKVISIFPGIVSHYQLDAFISRLNADQVWLNSKADLDLYSRICKLMNVKNNGLLYGMSWIDSKLVSKGNLNSYSGPKKAIFFEQTAVTPDLNSKRNLKSALIETFERNRDVFFKYKIRKNTSDTYFTDLRLSVSKFENVDVIDSLTDKDIKEATYFFSVSSSAIVEGLILNKICYILDSKFLDLDSKEFFNCSGLKLTGNITDKKSNNVNKKWLFYRVKKPLHEVDLLNIKKVAFPLYLKKRNVYKIRFFVTKLSLKKPILLKILFRKSRLITIQKALEYLGYANDK
ncbi:DUF6716 putative glycosyltransferase [Psychrobacter sp. S1-30-MNA-CIBAN-0213]|uniref:DUF6716 putative glycosyltransferase n=1 Tax=Psychrobacter sp. S1-30-MNA-CIBAN-0213 TaxID=3140456 RepID=UPI00331E6B1D